MEMVVPLSNEVEGFLKAEHYHVDPVPVAGAIAATRSGLGGDDYLFVWAPDISEPGQLRRLEPQLMRQFAEVDDSFPGATKAFVLESMEGVSRDLRERARSEFGVRITDPTAFFDTGFGWEAGRTAASATRQLQVEGNRIRSSMVAQPYTNLGTDERGDDLLLTLTRRMSVPANEPEVHIIAGPAGIGKSTLFAPLFADLLTDFQSKKRRRMRAARPLPLLPEHIPLAAGRTVRSLVDVFLATELARPIQRDVFDWLMMHGFATWMLDGLDEIIAADSEFLEVVLSLLTHPEAVAGPRVVVFVRDSLLASNGDVAELVSAYGHNANVYMLERWGKRSIGQFANIRFRDQGQQFVDVVNSQPSVREIATLPFYCNLLADLYEEGELSRDYSELELVDHAVDRMIDREYTEKQTIDPLLMPEESIHEFLQAVAGEDFARDYAGVPFEELREYAAVLMPSGITDVDFERLSEALLRLPFFSRSGGTAVRFSQEIVEQFFLGREFVRAYTEASSFRRLCARRPLSSSSLAATVIRNHVDRSGSAAELVERIEACHGSKTFELRNLVMILMGSRLTDGAGIRNLHDRLQYALLNGVVFDGVDLAGFEFRGSDLTDVVFSDCILESANFTDAVIVNTQFRGSTMEHMASAEFGNRSRLVSVGVDGRILSKDSDIASWIAKVTGNDEAGGRYACDAFLQLDHLFLKYVRQDGIHRRAKLPMKALLSGVDYGCRQEVVDECLHNDYLIPVPPHGHISRADGEKYREIVGFVREQSSSEGIVKILDAVCKTANCPHFPLD